jgi:hypothetical protein
MKKAFKLKAIRMIAGIAVMLAAIAFSIAACDDGSGSGGGGGGGSGGGKTLTITDIPSQYNGMYASAIVYEKNGSNHLWGNAPNNYGTPALRVLISNGKVTLPLWQLNPNTTSFSDFYIRFNGSGYVSNSIIASISASIEGSRDEQLFWYLGGPEYFSDLPEIKFSNNNTTVSFNGFVD